MDLSVVIPTLNAAATLPATLAAIGQGVEVGVEVVVVDGGSSDGAPDVARDACVLTAPRGRGCQLAAGIEAATHDWLLLLHADTRLSPGWQAVAAAHMATATPPTAACPVATPSWPGLSRPPTLQRWCVGGRDKPGHDGERDTPSHMTRPRLRYPDAHGACPGHDEREVPFARSDAHFDAYADEPGHDGNKKGASSFPQTAGYFRFRLDSNDPRARRLERLVAWRCRVLALPYGDQGLLVHRDLLADVGGMRPLPLMEDVDLIRRLGRRRLVPLAADAVTSAAKWERDGWTRRSLRNLGCLLLWFLGVPPSVIRRLYG